MASPDIPGDSPIPVELIPRLLTSLLTQKDIVKTMREVIGEGHLESMGMFFSLWNEKLTKISGFCKAFESRWGVFARPTEAR